MDKRLQVVASMVAVLLSGGSGGYLYFSSGLGPYRPHALQVSKHSAAFEQCMEGARMTYDVHWAAACTTQDGDDNDAECDLPPAKAAVVNAWLNQAEMECMAEARAGR